MLEFFDKGSVEQIIYDARDINRADCAHFHINPLSLQGQRLWIKRIEDLIDITLQKGKDITQVVDDTGIMEVTSINKQESINGLFPKSFWQEETKYIHPLSAHYISTQLDDIYHGTHNARQERNYFRMMRRIAHQGNSIGILVRSYLRAKEVGGFE